MFSAGVPMDAWSTAARATTARGPVCAVGTCTLPLHEHFLFCSTITLLVLNLCVPFRRHGWLVSAAVLLTALAYTATLFEFKSSSTERCI